MLCAKAFLKSFFSFGGLFPSLLIFGLGFCRIPKSSQLFI